MAELKPCPFCGGEARKLTTLKYTNIWCDKCRASIARTILCGECDSLEEADAEHEITEERVEDEHYITVHHPMTKAHSISFLASVTCDRLQMVKLYAEGDAAARLQLRGRGYLYYYCNRHGLYRKKI